MVGGRNAGFDTKFKNRNRCLGMDIEERGSVDGDYDRGRISRMEIYI